MSKKVVLITGASSGMGYEAAKLFAEQGHKVYAGARRVEKMADLAPLGVVPVGMDVTNAVDNKAAVSQIIAAEGRIDVLINNAGFGLYGSVEDVPIDDARYQFEVNLFGLADLTQRVLPHMRAQQSGRIVNTSSMGGKIFTPLGAWYHATKHALEGWSDCLRLELAPFGIQVSVIQPGGVKTEFASVTGESLAKLSDTSAYSAQLDAFRKMMQGFEDNPQGTEPRVLAQEFLKAATDTRPRRRYVKGFAARPMMFIRKWFGDGVFEWTLRRAFG